MTVESLRIPLLRDSHTHPMLYAALDEGVNLSDGESTQAPSELRTRALQRIRDHARRGLPGWTIAYGWNSGRYTLSNHDFDDLPPLVVFNLSLHGLLVNTAGRALLGQHDPAFAVNLEDQAWIERNLLSILNLFASADASPQRLQTYFRRLLENHGIFHAEEMLLVDEQEIHLLTDAGLLARTRIWAAPAQYDRLPPALQQRVHGIKLFADGALGARTAALHRPYRDTNQYGMLMYEPQELQALFRRYLDIGKPIALHAIGDSAIDLAIESAESVGLRHQNLLRIEHAQLITEPTARRAKALGITLCMQPNFSDDSIHYADRLPETYPQRNNPFRMLIDTVGYVPGNDLLFGSDGMPHGIQEALRQSLFPPHPSQTLTVQEFVAAYCLPDLQPGHIEVQINRTTRQVTCQIVPAAH